MATIQSIRSLRKCSLSKRLIESIAIACSHGFHQGSLARSPSALRIHLLLNTSFRHSRRGGNAVVAEKMIVRVVNAVRFEMTTWIWCILANARSANPSAVVFLLDITFKFPGPETRLSGSLREGPAREIPPQRTSVVFITRARRRPPRDGCQS